MVFKAKERHRANPQPRRPMAKDKEKPLRWHSIFDCLKGAKIRRAMRRLAKKYNPAQKGKENKEAP
jgi:hypothetical protein